MLYWDPWLTGARKIIAVDINPEKLKMAESLGATETYNANDPEVIQKIRKETGGGVEYAFETAGSFRR